MAVDVERYRNAGVIKDLLRDLGVLAGFRSERSEGVPEVVEADVQQFGALENGLKCLAARLSGFRPAVQDYWNLLNLYVKL